MERKAGMPGWRRSPTSRSASCRHSRNNKVGVEITSHDACSMPPTIRPAVRRSKWYCGCDGDASNERLTRRMRSSVKTWSHSCEAWPQGTPMHATQRTGIIDRATICTSSANSLPLWKWLRSCCCNTATTSVSSGSDMLTTRNFASVRAGIVPVDDGA